MTLIADLTDVLRQYLDTNAIVPVNDPWSRICDGFLLRVHVSRWPGRVAVTARDMGLDEAEYNALQSRLRAGQLDLSPDEIGRELSSIATSARQLPQKWGRVVHWGLFVPASAMQSFRDDWQALAQRWADALDAWVVNYDEHRDAARDVCAQFAARAWKTMHAVGAKQLSEHGAQLLDEYVETVVARLMADYPSRDALRERFDLSYELAFIPTPTLAAEQAADVERVNAAKAEQLAQMRRETELREYAHELEKIEALERISVEEAKQAEKLRLVREYREQTSAQLKAQAQKLLDGFYKGYMLDIRQRLHESLCLLQEGVMSGRITPQATGSLRVVLDEVAALAADGDVEIAEMRVQLARLPGSRVSAAEIKTQIEDLSILLQTSILAMGETPRTPKRMQGVSPIDARALLPSDDSLLATELRTRRERAGLSCSLAEQLSAADVLTSSSLRVRASHDVEL